MEGRAMTQQFQRNIGSFTSIESLEPRSLLSAAPTIVSMDVAGGGPVLAYRPFAIAVEAADDVGVVGVSLFMDLDHDRAWNPLVDRPLGDSFVRDTDGKFNIVVKTDSAWPSIADLVATAVDTEGQWSATSYLPVFPASLPVVTMLSATYAPVISIPEATPITMRAIVEEPFRGGTSVAGVTFFIDNNANGQWDSGVDEDLGYSTTTDADGAFTLTAYHVPMQGGTLIAASARASDTRFDHTNGFGPVRTTPFNILYDAPFIQDIQVQNLSGRTGPTDGPLFQVGDRVRLTIIVRGQRDLHSATAFFDANSNGRWDAGVDTDLGAFWFGPDVISGRARIDFTITPNMNFDYRAFVVASRNQGMDGIWDGGDYNWGATRTKWLNIVSPAWLDNIQAIPPDVQGQPLSIVFNAHDDHSISRFLAFIDANDNGQLDAGEASTNVARRLSGSFTNGRWNMAIDLTGVAHGNYKLKIFANDFDDGSRPAYSIDISV
jgi:hypothetical protein